MSGDPASNALHPEQGSNETSLSLIDRVRAKEQNAWRQLTELYGPLVYHWCRCRELREEDSADIVQDVFGVVFKHIDSFEKRDAGGSFRGWLRIITRNKILDFWKKKRVEADAVGGTNGHLRLLDVPDEFTLEDDDSESGLNSLVKRAAQMIRTEFRDKTWQAFWRTTVDDVSPAAVADELGMKLVSVYQAKSRVLRRLRDFLM
jgi:RNA polymerase sigma factor (sigma-70 family)